MSLDEVHYDLSSRLLRAWITDSLLINSYMISRDLSSVRLFLSLSDLSNLAFHEAKESLFSIDMVSRKMVDSSFEEALSITLRDAYDASPLLRSLFPVFVKSDIVKWYLIVSENFFKTFRSKYPDIEIDHHFDW